jgi:hypothetical protein
MDPYFLVGAIFGSALYVFCGRQPARRLVAAVRRRFEK